MSTEGRTSLQQRLESDKALMSARRFADQITHLMRDYLAPAVLRDVHDTLAKEAFAGGFELTSAAMRREYEALTLSTDLPTGQFSPQHKATPHG